MSAQWWSTSAAIDDLAGIVADFAPELGGGWAYWLIISCRAARSRGSPNRSAAAAPVITCWCLGHPYVDIWQAVRPARLDLEAWPSIPRDVEWKHGICAALGWRMLIRRHRGRLAEDPGPGAVWNDLERPLLTTVEQLIDFVTQDHPIPD
jgi:hypothetical protein